MKVRNAYNIRRSPKEKLFSRGSMDISREVHHNECGVHDRNSSFEVREWIYLEKFITLKVFFPSFGMICHEEFMTWKVVF